MNCLVQVMTISTLLIRSRRAFLALVRRHARRMGTAIILYMRVPRASPPPRFVKYMNGARIIAPPRAIRVSTTELARTPAIPRNNRCEAVVSCDGRVNDEGSERRLQ